MGRVQTKDGFTLIELLVVILIIGILIAVSAPSFLGQTKKASDSAAQQYLTVAYREAVASATDREGDFVSGSFDASSLAQAIHAGESELVVAAGLCPGDPGYDPAQGPDGDPTHVFVSSAFTSGDNLELCNDPTHRVWVLKVLHRVLQKLVEHDEPFGSAGGDQSASGFSGDLPVAAAGAPANDDFRHAAPLSVGTTSGTLVGATVQDGGVRHETSSDACSNDSDNFEGSFSWCEGALQSVWYYWYAPGDGYYRLDSEGSPAPFDGSSPGAAPLIEIVDVTGNTDWGQQDQWSYVGSDWGQSSDGESATVFQAQSAHEYAIRVDNSSWDYGYSSQSAANALAGDFTLNLTALQAPPDNQTPPAITSSLVEGQTLSATTGDWLNSPTSYSYTWSRCVAPLPVTDPANAQWIYCTNFSNDSSPTLPRAAVGEKIKVSIQACNDTGCSSADSAPSERALGAGPPLVLFDAAGANEGTGIWGSYVFDSALDGNGGCDCAWSWPIDTPPAVGSDSDPAWNADHTKIVFLSSRDTGGTADDVYTMNPDGTSVTRLTNYGDGDGTGAAAPSFTPDGHILFLAACGPDSSTYVCEMDADGGNVQALAAPPGVDDAAMSPDGTKIAYSATTSTLAASQVHLMNADGSGDSYFIDGSDPAWSPDGSTIAFVVYSDDSHSELHVQQVLGGIPADYTSGGLVVNPDYAPDGSLLWYQPYDHRVADYVPAPPGGGSSGGSIIWLGGPHPNW